MRDNFFELLRTSAEAKKAKAMLTLRLYTENPVAVGEHSTDDLYKDFQTAFQAYCEAKDELERLNDLDNELRL